MLDEKSFFNTLKPHLNFKRYLVGFSGGLDSTVLLHLLKQLREKSPVSIQLEAIHVNHQLHKNSFEWAKECQKICSDWNIFLHTKNVEVKPLNLGLEAAAREARYHSFASILQLEDVLLTAHQQDDQAETVLLQLMRGTGLAGLSGMASIKPLALGMHLRPLLEYSRDEIAAYAKDWNLSWIEDESNQSLNIQRNFIRRNVIPLLQTRWPAVKQALVRTSQNCAEAKRSLEYLSSQTKLFDSINPAEDALHLEYENGKSQHIPFLKIKKNLQKLNLYKIDLWKLGALPGDLQKHYLRKVLEKLAFNQKKHEDASFSHQSCAPNRQAIEKIFSEVIGAQKDAIPKFFWNELMIRKYQHYLYILPRQFADAEKNVPQFWTLNNHASAQFGEYKFTYSCKKGVGFLLPESPTLKIDTRKGGETIFLRGHHHKLKILFQEWNVPPWLRNLIPLIFYQNDLIAVCGFAIADNYLARQEEMGYLINVEV